MAAWRRGTGSRQRRGPGGAREPRLPGLPRRGRGVMTHFRRRKRPFPEAGSSGLRAVLRLLVAAAGLPATLIRRGPLSSPQRPER